MGRYEHTTVVYYGNALHMLLQCSIGFTTPYLQLIEKLLPMMPDKSLDSFFFWNSGSEAIEAAVKMARVFTGKQNIISMQGGYHGRTYGAMALTTSKTVYSEGFHPLMVSVYLPNIPCASVLMTCDSLVYITCRSRTGTTSVSRSRPHRPNFPLLVSTS